MAPHVYGRRVPGGLTVASGGFDPAFGLCNRMRSHAIDALKENGRLTSQAKMMRLHWAPTSCGSRVEIMETPSMQLILNLLCRAKFTIIYSTRAGL
jgi:hypothetical protein